ncbi:conserved protein of unknown function [Candidatus Hydrogenisulfobacillus filiaventi]|uniref:DUF3311 domain-containing protein n=1 Tax=Candidatus Hydrogenisulfobacillus filiaventi TaxID=2707344 RepID=A0A6F8ZER8_9FIRM|nr:DUF3311 domain-containing protein [Bacillota bacterium]CAB1127952.1 conserved protein of unknown function [Candidatus Hydrogenisulfobacillus filiaventi]
MNRDTPRAGRNRWALWLLLIPFLTTVWPSLYAKATPAVAGFPFFYWYLIVWVVLVAAITGLVYYLTR